MYMYVYDDKEDVKMTLKNFLKMHEGGTACVSVHQLPYDYAKHGYSETYFEEERQEEIIDSDIFREIASKQVDHFNVIGGGMYRVELCVYLKREGV